MIDTDQIPYGSSHYYALRFANSSLHPQLTRITALYQLIRTIPQECSDPIVGAKKLDWWQQELERAETGNSEHPITIGLAGESHLLAQFQTLISGVRDEVNLSPFPTEHAFNLHCQQTGTILTHLLAITANADKEELGVAEEMGIFIRTVETIRYLGRELRRGGCQLPDELLQQHNLSPSELMLPDKQLEIADALGVFANKAVIRCRNSLESLSDRPHPALSSPLSLVATSHALLSLLDGEGYPVVSQHSSLTPLRKLWIAWRTSQKVKRGRRVRLEWVE